MLSAIIFFLLLFTPLIFLHELGHYIVARLCGVRVEAFSVGFGKVVWSRQRWGTEWRLSAVPFGGYVKMAGENHSDDRTPEPDELWAVSPWARAAIAVAGPAVNLLLPVIVFTWFLLGGHSYVAPVIGAVNAGSAAARAGIMDGDRILRIDGQDVLAWNDLSELIAPAAGRSMAMVVRRGDEVITLHATPDTKTIEDPFGDLTKRGMLGITSATKAPVIVPEPGGALRPFDRVSAVDGVEVRSYAELVAALSGAAHRLTILRDAHRKPGERGDEKRSERLEIAWDRPATGLGFGYAELVVEGIKPGSAAAAIGLRGGDRIVSVGTLEITTWGELEQHLLSSPGFAAPIAIRRGGELINETLRLQKAEVKGPLRSSRAIMDHGIVRSYQHARPIVERRELGLFSAVALATDRCFEITATMAEGIRRILVGRVSVKQIGGPVMLYDIAAEVAKDEGTFWHWFTLLSLNLGLMNLLPVPVLDGGLILLSAIEILRRRPLTVALRTKANYIGLVLVLALMLTAVVNDLLRVFST